MALQEIMKGKGSGRSVCRVFSSRTRRPCRYIPARARGNSMVRRKARYESPSTRMATSLVDEGWYTPNTYANHYAEFPNAPGVYLFMKVGLILSDDVGEYRVLYVGKSLNLRERQNGHEMFAQICRDHEADVYIQRWFLPLAAEQISAEEVRLIKRFNPPYNIIHRVRGM